MPRVTRSSTRLSGVAVPCNDKRKSIRKVKIIDISSESEEEKEVVQFPVTPTKNPRPQNLNEESPATPPKQRKYNGTLSPINPPNTPSTLLKGLSLTSPKHTKENLKSTKPRKKRQSLFSDDNRENKLDDDDDILRNARRALHSSAPTKMPGREKELEELRLFIAGHVENETSGSIYISGPPGTGKTASLNIILQEENVNDNFKQVYVNCTAIKSANSIYSKIVKELGLKTKSKTEKESLSAIETYLKKNHKMVLLVLDEIDQLESKTQSILYTIFEWPSKNYKLILIGIANALDLTDRTLPRLQARCELKPKLMHFAPYSKQQIIDIFTARLQQAGVLDVFNPVALQMLAGKVAAISGDVRRALDIGRRVIELIDQNPFKSLENITELIDDIKPKKVDLKQVVDVLNNVYGTTQNLVEDQEDAFPLQQKIIICTLLLILKKGKNKDITIGRLHEVYRRVCSKRNLLAVDQSEFVGLCSLIETRGIVKVSGRKEVRQHKVNLEWDEEEVAGALKDKQLMSTILQDDTVLGNKS